MGYIGVLITRTAVGVSQNLQHIPSTAICRGLSPVFRMPSIDSYSVHDTEILVRDAFCARRSTVLAIELLTDEASQ